MTTEERPYIDNCTFCGNGLLRFYRCGSRDKIVALCDECELMWEDIVELSRDPNLSSDSCFPSSCLLSTVNCQLLTVN